MENFVLQYTLVIVLDTYACLLFYHHHATSSLVHKEFVLLLLVSSSVARLKEFMLLQISFCDHDVATMTCNIPGKM